MSSFGEIFHEVVEEVLKNTVYYVDSSYHEIEKRNKRVRKEEIEEKRRDLVSSRGLADKIDREIAEIEIEIEKLRKRASIRVISSTVDAGELVELALKEKNYRPSARKDEDAVHSVSFINTEIRVPDVDIEGILEMVKRIEER